MCGFDGGGEEMIFGKTQEQKDAEKQASDIRKILGQRKFRIICKLKDGRWALFQHVWEYHRGRIYESGRIALCWNEVDQYRDQSVKYVWVYEKHPEVHTWAKSEKSPCELRALLTKGSA